MKNNIIPKELGFFFPAEWHPHRATWLSWPHKEASWPGKIETVYDVYSQFVKLLAEGEKVCINVSDENMLAFAARHLMKADVNPNRIEFYIHPTNDAWCRDHGPAFLINSREKKKMIVDWGYNAWGEKYPPYDLDDVIPTLIGKKLKLEVAHPGIVMEGGSVDFNGDGTLLTTTACLLNKNRNPHLSQTEIESYLQNFYGVEQILWLEDVMPFLDNVLAGKNVPEARKREVAAHYEMFAGVSPINAQNRELKELLEKKIRSKGWKLPVFWGNRNWKPYIIDAIQEMKSQGIQSALAYVTSAYDSYSGSIQYVENIARACRELGPNSPEIEKLGSFYDHPLFIEANILRIQSELNKLSAVQRRNVHLAFTAHSIPQSMSDQSPYVSQLEEACRSVVNRLNVKNWKLVYQSRSGSPQTPWLGPDILEHLETLAQGKVKDIVVSPIGFVSDHMEVIYDLDVEARKKSQELGLNMLRAKTVGNHPLMINMIVDLIAGKID